MKEDAAIKEIRDTRKKISAEFNNSPVKLVEHYIDLQKKYKISGSATVPILSEKSAEYSAKAGKKG